MELAMQESKNDYIQFDCREYCKAVHSVVEQPEYPSGQQSYLMDSLSQIYNSGEITGTTLLDFGTGPSIYNLISAARHFPNIYLSDFCEDNRNALWRWLAKQPDSHDFSDFFQYVARKEILGQPWELLADDMRSRIKGILACDMTMENPIFPCMFPQFDVISTSLCLSVVPGRTIADYETAVQNVASLLKPRGWVVNIGPLSCTSYQFGKYKYDVLWLTKEDVFKAWQKAGCEPKVWKPYNRTASEIENCPLDDSKTFFCMTAQKV